MCMRGTRRRRATREPPRVRFAVRDPSHHPAGGALCGMPSGITSSRRSVHPRPPLWCPRSGRRLPGPLLSWCPGQGRCRAGIRRWPACVTPAWAPEGRLGEPRSCADAHERGCLEGQALYWRGRPARAGGPAGAMAAAEAGRRTSPRGAAGSGAGRPRRRPREAGRPGRRRRQGRQRLGPLRLSARVAT